MSLEWPEGMTVSKLLRECVNNADKYYGFPSSFLFYRFLGTYHPIAEDQAKIFLMLAEQVEKEIKQRED